MGEKKPKNHFVPTPARALTPEGRRRKREYMARYYIRMGQLTSLTQEARGGGRGWKD